MDQAAAGKKALASGDYDSAISHFTAALKTSPTSPTYLIDRSTAHHRAKNYPAALSDANAAVLNAQKRAKRELIVEAQFRRGCALYCLERYGDAEFVFGVVKRMQEGHKMVGVWVQKTGMALGKLEAGDERGICKVKETPEVEEVVDAEGEGSKRAVGGDPAASSSSDTVVVTNGVTSTTTETTTTANNTATSTPTTSAPQQTPPDKIRHEWYQSSTSVYFTLLAKGVPASSTQIDIQPNSFTISFPLNTGSSYDLTLDPLFGPIDTEKTTSRILPTKIEVVLAKQVPGVKWAALEGSHEAAVDVNKITTQPPIITSSSSASGGAENVTSASSSSRPVYPTSSKSGPKDWDKITAASLASTSNKTSTNGEAASLNDDDDEMEGGDEANAFFKKLFKNASPDVQRAMMKSYTESNGTALSTNWEEVKKGVVETSPPDGMVAKKW